MLDTHLPLEAAVEVISELRLDSGQVRRANRAMQRIVHRAWVRRGAAKRDQTLEAFADSVRPCHWLLMFKACALAHLGRCEEAIALIEAASHLRASKPSQRTP